MALVLDDNNDTLRKYTWGLDLSGTLHGAGGIGGLLACVETGGSHEGSYWYFYDANGNVGQVIDAGDYSIAARYEYDPYGNEVDPDPTPPDPYDDINPFRFSTKWLDTELAGESVSGAIGETGLYYYGYRYYSPRLGRCLNRDPIAQLDLLLGNLAVPPSLSGEHVLGRILQEFREVMNEIGLYQYALNQPTGLLDILGPYSIKDCNKDCDTINCRMKKDVALKGLRAAWYANCLKCCAMATTEAERKECPFKMSNLKPPRPIGP